MGSRKNDNGEHYYWDWPVADTQAEVDLGAPNTDGNWAVLDIVFGFDVAPAAGKNLTISCGGVVVFTIPVPDAGPKNYKPSFPITGNEDEAVVINLAADSGGAIGFLNVRVKQLK